MKILIIGALLFFSFASQAQFVTPQEAVDIIKNIEFIDQDVVDDFDTTSDGANPTYIQKRHNVMAYSIVQDLIESGETDVAAVIKQAVLSVGEYREFTITNQEYDTDVMPDGYMLETKNNLISLLTQ